MGMSFPWLSRLTTVRSFPPPATEPSNCGTLWEFANTPSKNRDTPNGSHASDSLPFLKIPLLFLLTDPSVLLAAVTDRPNFGTLDLRRPNPFTPSTEVRRSMLSASPLTDTGSAPPLDQSSKSGISNRKLSLRSSNLKLWDSHLSASPSAGAQTDRHYSPDTPMDSSVSGPSLSAPAPSSKLNQPFRHVLTRLVGNTVNFIDVY